MSLVSGKGVTLEKAERAFARSAEGMVPGEVAWFYARCQNYKPVLDAVAVTSHRVLGLVSGLGNNKTPFQAAHVDIVETVTDAAKGTVLVRTVDGEMLFKRMAAEDVEAVAHYLSQSRLANGPHPVSDEVGAPAAWDPTLQVAEALKAAAESRTTVYGHKADPEKVAKRVSNWPLLDGEFVWAYTKCNNLSPTLDGVAITNARLFAVLGNTDIRFMVAHSQIISVDPVPERGHLSITLTDGRTLTFKSMEPSDIAMIATGVGLRRAQPDGEALAEAAAVASEAHRRLNDPTVEERQAAKDDKRQTRQDDKAQKAAALAAVVADEVERYGTCVYDGMFGSKTVRIYDKGYVRVAFLALGSRAPFERLIDIETSVDVQKKTGVGRAVGAAFTLGVNLASSNKRGDIWITVITDGRTHMLHEDPPNAFNIAQAKKISGIGQSVVHRASMLPPGDHDQSPLRVESPPLDDSQPQPGEVDMADRLRRLNSLLAEGLISEDEYERKRTRLLDEL